MELQLNQIRFDDDDASILPLTSLCSALHVTDYDTTLFVRFLLHGGTCGVASTCQYVLWYVPARSETEAKTG